MVTTDDLGVVAGTVVNARVDSSGRVTAVGSVPAPSSSPGWASHPYVWRDGVGRDLGLPPGAPMPAYPGSLAVAEEVTASGDVFVATRGYGSSMGARWGDGGYAMTVGPWYQVEDTNESGQLVGWRPPEPYWFCGLLVGPYPFLWERDGTQRALPGLPVPGFSPDRRRGGANAVNDHGHAVGWSDSAVRRPPDRVCGGDTGVRHAVMWRDGAVIDLGALGGGTSAADAVNNAGLVVGTSWTASGQRRAFAWRDGVMSDIGTLGAAEAVWPPAEALADLSDSGFVVGASDTAAGERHAYVWRDGVIRDLGTLGGSRSAAAAVSERGQVVGASTTATGAEHAFSWQDGVMTDLGAAGGVSSRAVAVGEDGAVLGTAVMGDGSTHLVRWRVGADVAGDLRDLRADLDGVGPGRSLRAKADAALDAWTRGEVSAACQRLRALDNQLRAQSGKSVDASRAGAWRSDVAELRSSMGCAR